MISWRPRPFLKSQSARSPGQGRASLSRTGLQLADRSPKGVCEAAAITLEANAIVVESGPNSFVVLAASPWRPCLEVLDRVALDLCFKTARPSGKGSDQSAGSDWLFVPVLRGEEVVAAFGISGRYCRRRFNPDDALIRSTLEVLEAFYRNNDRALP